MAFNALKYVQELRDVGVSQEQAEVQAKNLQLIQDHLLDHLATKEDIALIQKYIKTIEDKMLSKKDIKTIEDKMLSKIDTATDKQALKIILSMTAVMAGLLALFGFVVSMFKIAQI